MGTVPFLKRAVYASGVVRLVFVAALLSIMFLGNDVLFQVQVWSFEIVDSGRENKEFTWMSSEVNPILYVVELLVVWSGFLLSEALQDTDRYEGAIAKGSTSSDGTMSPLSGSSADTSSDTVGSESYDGLACDNSMAIMIEIGSTDSSCSAFV